MPSRRRTPSELMTVPRTDPDLRAPASPAREESTREKKEGQLSALQVAAGALAAVSAAVAASFFGVAGTLIGAAVASVVSTVGAAVYTESMRRTHAGLRRAGGRLVLRQATFARLMSSARRMTLRSLGSVTWRFR